MYSTYFSGGPDSRNVGAAAWAYGVAVDSAGEAYLDGGTQIASIPTTSGFTDAHAAWAGASDCWAASALLKKKINYNATRFNQMLGEHGGVETARRRINADTPSQGFGVLPPRSLGVTCRGAERFRCHRTAVRPIARRIAGSDINASIKRISSASNFRYCADSTPSRAPIRPDSKAVDNPIQSERRAP